MSSSATRPALIQGEGPLPGESPPGIAVRLGEHGRWLRTVVASRLGEPSAVEDVLQQVALALVSEQEIRTNPTQLGPWLYRVAVRQCLMHRRSAGRRRRFVEGYAQRTINEHDDSPLEWLLQLERRESVRLALQQLAEIDRQVLLLKYTENWTYAEMASRLGVSRHAIEHRLGLARRRLRQILIQMGAVEASS